MLTLITPPAAILTADEAKSEVLRIVHHRDDDAIEAMIAAATAYLDGPEGILGRCIAAQQWIDTVSAFTDPLRIPIGPVSAVVSVEYLDTSGVEQTVPPADYYMHSDGKGAYLRPVPGKAWPGLASRDDAVRVTFTAGYAEVPKPIRSAILILVSHLYEFREVQVREETFPSGFGFWDLIAPYRRVF
jgi:uncharacterized phiE125 gp8 family phage protein